jgi:hypothetical protein
MDRKILRSYVEPSLYEDVRELAYMLNISMSKLIAMSVVQGLECIRADFTREIPDIKIKELKEYIEKNNLMDKYKAEVTKPFLFPISKKDKKTED